MSTHTIALDEASERLVAEAARLEAKPVADWLAEHVSLEAKRAHEFARLEAHARSRGYPPGWTTLSGSLAHDETFTAPPRHTTRPVQLLD